MFTCAPNIRTTEKCDYFLDAFFRDGKHRRLPSPRLMPEFIPLTHFLVTGKPSSSNQYFMRRRRETFITGDTNETDY